VVAIDLHIAAIALPAQGTDLRAALYRARQLHVCASLGVAVPGAAQGDAPALLHDKSPDGPAAEEKTVATNNALKNAAITP
jgi:hypothetical protein